ncbi:MAG: hypothetical protein U9N45_05995, partial [Gemmatimonadota bacterium]|nr:hypothetical protein [Gemmatimonadota bacterium]
MPYVLALDFDGVLSDSLLEAYLITWRISGRIDPTLETGQIKPPALDNIHEFRRENPGHWQSFLSMVPFANRAEDYLVVQKAVHLGHCFSTQEEFSSFRNGVDWKIMEAFHEEFYAERYRLEALDREKWLALNETFPRVREALGVLAKNFELSVATSKDARTVRAVLESYGVAELFESGLVLDKFLGASKKAHLSALKKHFGCSSFSRISFVDDKVSHLIDCQDLGACLYLAAWGYNGAQEIETARTH